MKINNFNYRVGVRVKFEDYCNFRVWVWFFLLEVMRRICRRNNIDRGERRFLNVNV